MPWRSVTQEELNGKIDKMLAAGEAKFMGINLKNVMHNICVIFLSTCAVLAGFSTDEVVMKYVCGAVMFWMAIVGIKWED